MRRNTGCGANFDFTRFPSFRATPFDAAIASSEQPSSRIFDGKNHAFLNVFGARFEFMNKYFLFGEMASPPSPSGVARFKYIQIIDAFKIGAMSRVARRVEHTHTKLNSKFAKRIQNVTRQNFCHDEKNGIADVVDCSCRSNVSPAGVNP